MKRIITVICAVLFAMIFPISCISSSFDPSFKNILKGYFAFHSTAFTFVRYLIFFIVIFILTAVICNFKRFLLYCFPIELSIVLLATFYDYFISHRILYNYNYVLWLCVAISVPCAAVFLSSTLFMKEGYKAFYKVFWMTYFFLYAFLIYDVFFRTPYSFGMSVNMKIGQGTLKYIPYVLHNLNDGYMILVCAGNYLVFVPLALIIKAFIPKANNYLYILIGLITPLLVEGYQYIFKCGNVDIDDLLLNWAGFFTGYIILYLINKYKIKEIA